MLPDEIKKYCLDIISSLDSIEEFLGGNMDFVNYQSNKMLRRAVERELEIIGEAMSKILKIKPDIEISSKKQIIGMRNRVIHSYDNIDDNIVWGTIIRHLPVLRREIENFL